MSVSPRQLRSRRHQQGLSLVELMVAATLSLILLAGVLQIFMGSKQTYRMQQAIARVQENVRFASTFLGRGLRAAGYAGCFGSASVAQNIADGDGDGNPDAVGDLSNLGLTGYEYTDLPVAVTDGTNLTTGDVVANTDFFEITDTVGSGLGLTGNLTADNANIQLDPSAGSLFEANDLLIISDCTDTDVFRATNVSSGVSKTTIAHSNSANLSNKLSKAYQDDAEVLRLRRTTFYIGTNGNGNPALFRTQYLGSGLQTDELVENVQNMQVRYGEDTDGDGSADRYVPSSSVSDWTAVMAARVELLVRSEDNILDEADNATTYDLLGTSVGPFNDRRLRRTLATTFTIRNRL